MENDNLDKPSREELAEVINNVVIKPTSDVFIADLFSNPNNGDMLCSLINAVIDDTGHFPIISATVLTPFNIKEYADAKRIVLDVRVQDETGRYFNIEIQTASHKAFHERIVFGWSNSYSQQIIAGNDYVKLNPVFCIVITEFDVFKEVEGVHFVFELRERDKPDLILTNHLQIHYLRLYELLQGHLEVLNDLRPGLQYWLLFMIFGSTKGEADMAQLVNNDPNILKACREFQRFTTDPAKREVVRQRLLAELDFQLGMTASKEEGKEESKLEIAHNMKREGYAVNAIAKLTGLSVSEIENLK